MAGKRKQTRRRRSTRTTSAAVAEPGLQRVRSAPRAGRAESGSAFDPGATPRVAAAAGATAEYDRPRPAKTRFPIDLDDFARLKDAAPAAKLRGRGLTAATIERDSGRRAAVPRTAAAVAAAVGGPLGPETAAAPGILGSFAGIADTQWFPADCTAAAGPAHVLAAVNSSVAVYAKTGGAPLLQKTLTAWFSNVITEAKIFDPKALYDQHAGRWVLLAVAVGSTSNTSWFLLSISKTSDPLGGWWNYKLDATRDGTTATNNWADYPGLGVDAQALYITANMFQFGGNFRYAKVRIVPKGTAPSTGPYFGGAAAFKDLVNLKNADGTTAFTVQPCHTYGAPQVQYLVNSLFPTTSIPTRTLLSLWALSDPLGTPAITRRNIGTRPYGLPPDATQKGSSTRLDTGDVRMLCAVFRGGSVWAALTSRHAWSAAAENVAVAHWFQIDASTGAMTQQGIFGAAGRHYCYPAVMPDGNGNMTMVFSRSGSAEFASARFSGRLATDPLGALQSSAPLRDGTARYVRLDGMGRNRWGDYAGIASDPTDIRTIWVYTKFAAGVNVWGTWIGASRF
ncbi:MAG TPA: hypothetical protein VF121_05835 [Thermoanaerobaculia bacterium]|nr:hypothetical protein [Thermoanaerobaculia bacterium]